MYSARCQVDAMAALLSALSAELIKKTIATRNAKYQVCQATWQSTGTVHYVV